MREIIHDLKRPLSAAINPIFLTHAPTAVKAQSVTIRAGNCHDDVILSPFFPLNVFYKAITVKVSLCS